MRVAACFVGLALACLQQIPCPDLISDALGLRDDVLHVHDREVLECIEHLTPFAQLDDGPLQVLQHGQTHVGMQKEPIVRRISRKIRVPQPQRILNRQFSAKQQLQPGDGPLVRLNFLLLKRCIDLRIDDLEQHDKTCNPQIHILHWHGVDHPQDQPLEAVVRVRLLLCAQDEGREKACHVGGEGREYVVRQEGCGDPLHHLAALSIHHRVPLRGAVPQLGFDLQQHLHVPMAAVGHLPVAVHELLGERHLLRPVGLGHLEKVLPHLGPDLCRDTVLGPVPESRDVHVGVSHQQILVLLQRLCHPHGG
mmetsp:Transcript_12072/g.29528  ORF Transcript_12072/g.29528 Transcript_12072/m.29528 type:complete len:308 (-) Transcript_12072:201-1124(-)